MSATGNRETASQPGLFDGAPPSEIVAPVALVDDDRVDVAVGYALHWGLPLRLVHVDTNGGGSDVFAALETMAERLGSSNPTLTVSAEMVEAGSVAGGVVAAANDRSVVVLPSARGSRWLDEESVAVGVVKALRGLVMLHGPSCDDPPVGSSIIVPLDGSRFAEQALQPAFAIASRSGAPVWLVTVGPAASVDAASEMLFEGIDDSERRYLKELTARFRDAETDIRLETTDAADPVAGIDRLAAEHDSSLIVAATHGDSSGDRSRFGSVCLGLVEHGRVPALLITGQTDSAETNLN
ncbi:MAG: universal stress protein [Acidimicrobiales bacterium]